MSTSAISNDHAVLKVLLGIVVALAVIAAIAVGGWRLHWWLYSANLNQQYRGNVGSQQFQAGIVSHERDLVASYQQVSVAMAGEKDAGVQAADTSQLAALKGQFCTQYVDLNPPPQDLVVAHQSIC